LLETIKDRIDQYPLAHVDWVEKAICCMSNVNVKPKRNSFFIRRWYDILVV
jgi:hypothetical protein